MPANIRLMHAPQLPLKTRQAKVSHQVCRAVRSRSCQSRNFSRFDSPQPQKILFLDFFLGCSPMNTCASNYQSHISLKHDSSAGGMVFALLMQRTGNLDTQTAAAIRYFDHDYLGSTTVVINEAGTVIKRIAFYAWDELRFRRFVNGTTDSLDSITEAKTDFCYTTVHNILE